MIGAINRSFKRNVKRKVHYGWVILGLTFTNLMIEGGAKNVQPVFLVAFRDSFRSSTTLASAIFSVSGLVGGVSAPFLGRLLDRFGPRVMFPIAATVILVGWLASSMAGEMWQLFIFYSVIATLGQFTISSFSATATLAPWFPRSKGIVLGMADSGNPAGQAIVVPLAQLIVTTMGWRTAYQVFGVAFFLLGAPLNLLFQRRPPDASPDVVEETEGPGEAAEAAAPEAEPEAPNRIPIREALSYPPVWFLLSSRAAGSVANQMTTVHIIAFLILSGYGALDAAVALGAAGLLGIGARPGFGLLSDVWGREVVFTVSMAMLVSAILMALLFGGGGVWWALMSFVALTGLSDGLNGLLIGAKAADLYPPRMLGTVMGVVEAGRGIGIAVGPVLAGALYDWQQDYFLAFSVSIGLTAAATVLFWGARLTQREARY